MVDLPTSCFVFPYIFIAAFIIIHIVIFFLITKFIGNVQKLTFLWGMINWTVAIGVLFFVPIIFIPIDKNTKESGLKILRAIIGGIIPPITEDVGRLIVFTFIYISKNHNFNNSLIFGAGHGGWESIVLMAITQISNLINFYKIKNTETEEDLNDLLEIYKKYKDGMVFEDYFGFIIRFVGNIYHMAASVIIYKLSLNRKDRKYIIYFIIMFICHFIIDTTGTLQNLFDLSIWYNLIFPILVIIIAIASYFVWEENKNKDFSNNELENKNKDSGNCELDNKEKLINSNIKE